MAEIELNARSTFNNAADKVPGDPFYRTPAAVQQEFWTAYGGSRDYGGPAVAQGRVKVGF